MAFDFQAYRNPYVSTIADLLSRGEDAKAKALVDVANAQARAAEARGQAYGGAVQDIGRIAAKALTDYTTEKRNAPIRAAEADARKALGEQNVFAAGQRARTLASQTRGDTAARIYNDAINGGSSSPQTADVDGTNRPLSAAGQDAHPYIIKVNGASLYDVDKFQQANAAAGVAVEGAPFVEEMQRQNEFRKRTQTEAQVRAQAQAGLLLGMPDDQLMQHAPAAVAALRGLYNDDALNAFMDIHGTGDVARVRQALGQLAGAKYDKPVVPGGTMQSQFGDTRTNPGTPPVKIEGNPVSMLEDGKPVSVVRVTTPNGGNAFQHVDGSPVTGTLTGVPDFEYVTRNGRVMSIPKGTRMPTDTQAPAPRVSSMPGSIGAAIDDGRVGDDALKGLPASTQALLKKIANYEADITSIPTRNGERERVAGIVSLYDPSWDQSQYKSRSALRQNFTSGDKSKNIGTLNTAVAHIGELQDAIGKLNNTWSDTYNSIANWASTKRGHADTLNFRTAANAVAAELASLYKGGSATDPEIEKWLSGINSSESPEQLQGFVNTAVNLLRGRLGAIEDSWTAGMGKPRNFSILSPTSRATLTRIGQDAAAVDTFSPTGTPTNPTGMVVVTAPDNTKHEFATQALADEFKRQIGMN